MRLAKTKKRRGKKKGTPKKKGSNNDKKETCALSGANWKKNGVGTAGEIWSKGGKPKTPELTYSERKRYQQKQKRRGKEEIIIKVLSCKLQL